LIVLFEQDNVIKTGILFNLKIIISKSTDNKYKI